jgi:hypothetical protein
MRSSFAAEAATDAELAELDRYGRPSFAAFESNPKAGRGKSGMNKARLSSRCKIVWWVYLLR